ncbi:MAG: trypsin-like serine protease [Gemmatirosa sp.]
MRVISSPAVRAAAVILVLPLAALGAQAPASVPAEMVESQVHPQLQLHVSEYNARRYLTTADVSNPNGVVLQNPGGSPPPSGSATGINDPALGFNNQRYWAKGEAYSGVTRLIMTYDRRNATTGAVLTPASFLCTGALINGGNSVLTAAHCVFDDPPAGGVVSTLRDVQISLGQNFGGNATQEPGAGAPGTNQAFAFNQTVSRTNVAIHPDYTGAVIDERDIAVINLNTPAPSQYRSYELYAPSALGQQYNVVGWGGRGNGNDGTVNIGGSTGSNQRIRQGVNSFNTTYADARWNPAFLAAVGLGAENVYLADFDNGTTTNNALCRLTNAVYTAQNDRVWLGDIGAADMCGLGFGLDEVSSAGGDSGGPSFINGQIAAVTSFGQSFGLGDIKAGLNSSFGELNGMTRVDINAQWVASAVVPEPTTIVLLGGGLLALGFVGRRRKA